MTGRRDPVLLMLAGGATIGLAWLPFGLAPIYPLSAFLAMRGLRRAESFQDAVVLGLAYGVSIYVVGSHFLLALLAYSPLAIVFYLFAILYILPFALVEVCGAFWLERRFALPRSIGLALLYPLMEKVRATGEGSFPADLFAHAFGYEPAWLAWSSWTGPYGVTLLAFVAGALLEQAWVRRGRFAHAAAWGAAALALWLAPPATAWIADRRAADEGPVMTIAVVQPSVTVQDKMDRGRWPELWRRLDALTLEAARGADLVVWPETARPGRVVWREPAPFADGRMEDLARRAGVPILYGCDIVRVEGARKRVYNGAALVRPDGGPAAWYGKQRLLPLVERVPFAETLGLDPATRHQVAENSSYLTMMGNFSPGPVSTIFSVGPLRIGVLICYEGFYASLARRYRLDGANVLAVITNDRWWGRSIFPSWHARMISSRARELDLPVIRAANSGVSSFTDRFGRMQERTGLFEVTTMRVRVRPGPPTLTFYARHGDWIVTAMLLVIGAVVGLGVLRRLRGSGSASQRGGSTAASGGSTPGPPGAGVPNGGGPPSVPPATCEDADPGSSRPTSPRRTSSRTSSASRPSGCPA